jgi:regulator of cell morphogenesis and NO signaling
MPTSTQSIREIVSTQTSAAAVLQRFDIDLCSSADTSLEQACAELQLSVDQVLEKLADAAVDEHGPAGDDLAGYSLGRLIQHIVRTHHQYVRRELPRLAEMACNLAGRIGDRAPALKSIGSLLEELRADLFTHLEKEEHVLFPFIAAMDQDSDGTSTTPRACFRTVAQPVRMMMLEHESAGSIVAELRLLTNEFQPPRWACPTHVALYAGLREFEADLRRHVHLEDDLLFPRAIALESTLRERR